MLTWEHSTCHNCEPSFTSLYRALFQIHTNCCRCLLIGVLENLSECSSTKCYCSACYASGCLHARILNSPFISRWNKIPILLQLEVVTSRDPSCCTSNISGNICRTCTLNDQGSRDYRIEINIFGLHLSDFVTFTELSLSNLFVLLNPPLAMSIYTAEQSS